MLCLVASDSSIVVNCLTERLETNKDEKHLCLLSELLAAIEPDNRNAHNVLLDLAVNSESEYIRREAIIVVEEIAINSQDTINLLLRIICQSSNEYVHHKILHIMGKMARYSELFVDRPGY